MTVEFSMTEDESKFIEGLFNTLKGDISDLRDDVKNLPCGDRGERLTTLEANADAKDRFNGIARENKTLSIRAYMLILVLIQLGFLAVNLWISSR